jgi:hypothetical protein
MRSPDVNPARTGTVSPDVSRTVCNACKRPFVAPDEPIELVEVDRFILDRTPVEIEGCGASFHPACVDLVGPDWRPPRHARLAK